MRRLSEERGQATVLFAISSVLLLSVSALSLDAGRAYILQQGLKTAADAAALAGAQDLPGNAGQAQADAATAAEANGVSAYNVQSSVSGSNQTITVTTTGSVSYFFAPIFGIHQSTVNQTSAATIGPIGEVQGAVPLGVFQQPFTYGQTYTLKAGAGGGTTGDYGALSLPSSNGSLSGGGESGDGSGDNGASQYENNLANGDQYILAVGEQIQTEPGDMVGPTDQGLAQRISQDPGATASTVAVGSPRTLLVPVLSDSGCTKGGRTTVTVVGFAAFFLQSVSNGDVTGTFLHMVMNGQPTSTAGNFGLEGERLTE